MELSAVDPWGAPAAAPTSLGPVGPSPPPVVVAPAPAAGPWGAAAADPWGAATPSSPPVDPWGEGPPKIEPPPDPWGDSSRVNADPWASSSEYWNPSAHNHPCVCSCLVQPPGWVASRGATDQKSHGSDRSSDQSPRIGSFFGSAKKKKKSLLFYFFN